MIRSLVRRSACLALVPAALLVFGCGSGGPAAQDSSALTQGAQGGVEAPPPTEEEPDALVRFGSQEAERLGLRAGLTGDLDAMIERGYIRALVPYSKTTYFLDGLQQRGTSYELLKLFEEWVNQQAGTGTLKVRVVPIPAARDELLPGVVEGLADLALGALTITGERQEIVDFGAPLASGISEIIVTGPTAAPLGGLDDLSGRTIYVRESSSYYRSLVALNEDLAGRGLEPATLVLAEEYLEDEDLLEMVNAGMIETIVVDQYKAEFWAQIFDRVVLHPDVAVRTGGEIAWAFRKGSPQLAEMVNGFVARNRKGTLTGNVLFNRYLRDADYIRNALAEDELTRFREAVQYFQQYAPQYEFDYLMMVAQGYQESKLDQSLVSHRGAVGIMQLLPSTAADKAVGIPEIEVAEKNIHAGIRYMRWIRDTYFDDPAIDDRNKTLMSFASYNAGPNRIARLRSEAASRGLDPNRWFRNVEIVVAEQVGRETVDYVANIYKYYAAYRMLSEQEAARSAR